MTPSARVLVVDDERSMQEFLEIFLRSEGYEVATAGDMARRASHVAGSANRLVRSRHRLGDVRLLHRDHQR